MRFLSPPPPSSLLQGAWLRLLRGAGGDGHGAAVGQRPGRSLLCQPGPQQRPDGHGAAHLTCPITGRLVGVHLPEADAQTAQPAAPAT